MKPLVILKILYHSRLVSTAVFLSAIASNLIVFGLCANLTKSDWASWVQAIGSIAAILGAIWAVLHQHQVAEANQAAHERRQLRNFLNAIKSEIEMFEVFLRDVDETMVEHDPMYLNDGRFQCEYARVEIQFPIYTALASMLGNLTDDHLRSDIITTYAELKAFSDELNRNTAYLEKWGRKGSCPENLRAPLKQMGEGLRHKLDELLPLVARVKRQIDERVK